MITTQSQDAIERRRLLDRAAVALRQGRIDSDKFRSLTAKHEWRAAPVGYDAPQPQARKVQRSLFEP